MDDASRQTDVPTQVAPVESQPGPAGGPQADTGAVQASETASKPFAQEQVSSEARGPPGPGASSLAPAANAPSGPNEESSPINPALILNQKENTQMPSTSTQGTPVAQTDNSHVSPVAQERSSDAKVHSQPAAVSTSTSTNKSNAAQEGHSNSSSPALTERQPPGHPPAPAGVKKFSSSLSTNKKFLEKTNTGTDPSKTLGAPRPNSSNAGRSSTSPSPGLPAATPPNAPALLSTNSQGPRLISGKIGQPSGRAGGAPAASSGPPHGWGRPVLASAAQQSSSSSTSPALSAPAPPSSRYSTLMPPSMGRNRSAASPVSASPDAGHGRGPPAPVWGQVPQRPGQESGGAGPRPGQQPPSMDGEFPSVAEAARSSQLKAHAVATAIAAKETQDKQAKEEAAAAAEAYQKHMLEEDDAFRGVHIQGHAHWDEMEDEDFGDVVDFGDGATYTLQVSKQEEDSKKAQDAPAAPSQAPPPTEVKPRPEAPPNRAPAARPEEQPRGQQRAPPRAPANEFDRGHHNEGRSLFNDRIGKLEPFSRDSAPHSRVGPPARGAQPSRSPEMSSRPEPKHVLSRPPPGESAPEFPPSSHHPRQHHAGQPPPPPQERHEPGQKRPSWSQGQNRPPPPRAWGDPAQHPRAQADQQPQHRPLPSRYQQQPQPHQHAQPPKAGAETQPVKPGQPAEAARSPTAPAPLPPAQAQQAPSGTGPSLTKDDLETYHSDMQSAAERARKRRQEEEDARKAEQERLKQERLKALDEKIKASQPAQPPPPATAPEAKAQPTSSSAKTPSSSGPQSDETRVKWPSMNEEAPIKDPVSEHASGQLARKEQEGQRQQPVKERGLADPGAKQHSDQTPVTWRDNALKAASPTAKREPLPSQGQAAEAALRQPRAPTVRKEKTTEDGRPTAPARQAPANHDRTEREWRRAVPVTKPARPVKEAQAQSPRSPGPSNLITGDALPQQQPQQQQTPTLVNSVWPTSAFPGQSASPEQSTFGSSGAALPSSEPISETQPEPRTPKTSGSPSSLDQISPQPHHVLSDSASEPPVLPEDQPKAEDKAADQPAPRVKLSGQQARSSQHHGAGKPLQPPSKAGHKSALSSSSFDAALARIKGVMAGSHEQADHTSPEPQASSSSTSNQADHASHRPIRQATPSKPALSLEQLDDIMTHFATTSEDRPASPRPVWRVLPKVRISRDATERSLPPGNGRQQQLLAKADARRDHKLWISSLPRAYFTSTSALFAQRGPMSVKLKPTPKVAEARPIRDPRPGVPNVPGTWRQSTASKANGIVSEEAGQPELAATGQDIFAEAVQTPDRTPKIQVVLPTPIRRPSAATARGHHASAGVKAEMTKPLSSRPFTEASEGIDPNAEEFVPRSILGSRAVSADRDTPSLRSTSATPSAKSNTDEQAATLSLVKSVWDQPSPDTEFAAASRPSNSLDGLLMDDFPGAMPTMADLRSEDGMSVPSSRNVSPVSRPAAALPSDAISAIGTGSTSVSTGSIATATSALPQDTAPLPQAGASYSTPASASQPVNTMPLPGARNPAMPSWSPSMQAQPQAAVPGSHQQQRMFSPPGGYSNPLSEVNPAFSGGIWMPVRPPSTISPFASNSPNGMHPSLSYTSSPSPHPHSYPQIPGYSMGSQPRSPVGASGGYGYPGPGPSQGSPYGPAPEPPYGAFSQPNGLSPFPGPVQPSPSSYRGGYKKRW